MATVFMKWLETDPRRYERGIRLLTLGRLGRVRASVADGIVRPGARVLELGCGTGRLAVRMADRGAEVTAVDASPAMLAEARRTVGAAGLGTRVRLEQLDATEIADRFPAAAFDLVVAVLVFSELAPAERCHVLRACALVLAPGGRLVVVDEVPPAGGPARLGWRLVRGPLALLTWLLSRATTRPLRGFEATLAESGFQGAATDAWLGGSLILYRAVPGDLGAALPPGIVAGRLRHRVTPRTVLVDLWAAFLRPVPPYSKTKPGLYAVGRPGSGAPVLVTGNFDLTVRRVVRVLDGRVDAWLLVVDSAGINVWCAAGGGFLTAERVIAAVKSSGLADVVDHRRLILPQLCANGVDGWRVREALGWEVSWGPVRAADIPGYLAAGGKKSAEMRLVRFPLADRLEMVSATLGLYGLMILVPVWLLWRPRFWPVALGLVCLSYAYAVAEPWLPGRDGLAKSVPLAALALAGLAAYTAVWSPASPSALFDRALGVVALSVFVGAEMQGMSPRMRGEQANWVWEAVIGAILVAAYFLVPALAGWR